MGIILLFVFFSVLLGFVYRAAERDIMHPAVVFCTAYLVSAGCAMANTARWNIRLSWLTFAVLAVGALEFAAITLAVPHFMGRPARREPSGHPRRALFIRWNPPAGFLEKLIGAVCVYSVVVIGLMVWQILAIAGRFGTYDTLSEALTLYKDHASYSIDAHLPSYVTIMLKPMIAFAYVMLFLFFQRMVFGKESFGKKLRRYWYYLLPVALYVAERLFESNRGAVIDLAVSGITMYFIFWNASRKWRQAVSARMVAGLFAAGAAGLLLFYFSASLIGRINTKGMLEYITYYCGGSIECFNRYLGKPPKPSGIFGEETFYRLIVNLDSLGITNFHLEATQSGHFPFQYYRNIMIGNVYTAYRRWIQDFGFFGAALLQGGMALLFGWMYQKIRLLSPRSFAWECLVLLYSYLSYCIYLHPIDGYLYFEVISMASAAALAMLFAVHFFLYSLRVRTALQKKNTK